MKSVFSVSIYRFSLGDCSNNGISARYDSLTLFDEDWTKDEIEEYLLSHPTIERETCIQVETLWRGSSNEFKRANVVFPRTDAEGLYVASGNYVGTSNSVFNEICKYPIPLLDRFETWEEYDRLSR